MSCLVGEVVRRTAALFSGDGLAVVKALRLVLLVHVVLLLYVLPDLGGEPLDALVEALAGDGVARADVPRLVHYPLQTKGLEQLVFHMMFQMDRTVLTCETLTLDMASFMSILLAKKRMGILRGLKSTH